MLKYLPMLLLLLACPALAAESNAEPLPAYLTSLACRIVTRDAGTKANMHALSDVVLDTLSENPIDRTFHTAIKGGRTLGASVQHVTVNKPRDRFNVTLTLDGRTHLRMNHLDLDIYLETVIDGQTYILHCFRDIV